MKASDWHFVTSLQVCLTRAILTDDKRGEQVLAGMLKRELATIKAKNQKESN